MIYVVTNIYDYPIFLSFYLLQSPFPNLPNSLLTSSMFLIPHLSVSFPLSQSRSPTLYLSLSLLVSLSLTHTLSYISLSLSYSLSLFLSLSLSLFLSLSLSLQVDAGDGEGADTSGPTTVAFEARQLKTLFLRLYDR